MTILTIGRCPFPDAALKYAVPHDAGDHEVIARSNALPAGVFHGLVELVCGEFRSADVLSTLEDGGWRKYDPPRTKDAARSKPEGT